jgi:hypothetical protein
MQAIGYFKNEHHHWLIRSPMYAYTTFKNMLGGHFEKITPEEYLIFKMADYKEINVTYAISVSSQDAAYSEQISVFDAVTGEKL